MGRSISFHWFFIILTMVFNIVHFFSLYDTTESYNATLVERHGFQESGRHSNLIYLVLNPL